MITQIFEKNCIKVLALFSISPGSRFNRKEIKEKTRLNNIPLDNSLLRLLSSGILKKERNYYSVDFENGYSKDILNAGIKQFKQLRELPLDAYYIIMELSDYFSVIKNIELVLFGSYAKLTYSVKSDVDIALIYEIGPDKKKVGNFIAKLKKVYGKNIEIHYFEKKSFYKNKKDPLVRSILKDGLRIA